MDRRLTILAVIGSAWMSAALERNPPFPSLKLLESSLHTTASHDFDGHESAYRAAAHWDRRRLQSSSDQKRAPHFACAEYGNGREAMTLLEEFLSPGAVRFASNSAEIGSCFIATASYDQATFISEHLETFGLLGLGPFLSALKLAPGLLNHHEVGERSNERLATTHGERMRMENVEGLTVGLTPGTLPMHAPEAFQFISTLMDDLTSKSLELHAGNIWSDPAMEGADHHLTEGGGRLARAWSRAADVIHELSEAVDTSPADICSWHTIKLFQGGNDILIVSGLDHLLFSGKGVGGQGEEAAELHVACFMVLVSFLAGKPEVLMVAPRHRMKLLNAAARANIQSASVTSTPFTDAGLDGTGEVIQVIDSGLDESSCFFSDESGEEIEHGYFFDEIGIDIVSPEDARAWVIFTGGDFPVYPTRRKVIQYINLVKSDSEPGAYGDYFTTDSGRQVSWIDATDFEQDDAIGHGTHTAGSAAGAVMNSATDTPTWCVPPDVPSCVGGCISSSSTYDDFVSLDAQLATVDLDRLCPMYNCSDTYDDEICLSGNVTETLKEHGGMAQGAKLAIFDVFYDNWALGSLTGNAMWEVCAEAGCKVHSNSWGTDVLCDMGQLDVYYDDYMYDNPENLLIFAAGNFAELEDGRDVCTIASPAIAKNVLAIGSTSSGTTRVTTTGTDGELFNGFDDRADIDTVSYFSSRGPTRDNRIKPEVVAPGDMIYSAASDGTDGHSCRLWAFRGTSMSCPIVAGAAAMVRQYFVDEGFYAADIISRGLCDNGFICVGFSPSSATVKALLINSANLMGGSSEPDYERGFGRIHMEAGMPLAGQGDLVLFVADVANTSIAGRSTQNYLFDIDGDAGLDLRATISWIDPASTSISNKQLVHDLDLEVTSPNGTSYTMWSNGETDEDNVNERVIIDASDVENGTWTVSVSAKELLDSTQSYSLIVNGAILGFTEGGTWSVNNSSIPGFGSWGSDDDSASGEETGREDDDSASGEDTVDEDDGSTREKRGHGDENCSKSTPSARARFVMLGMPIVLGALTSMFEAAY